MNFSQIIASLLLTIAAAEEATGVLRRDLLTCDNVRHLRGAERELRCSGCLVADCAAGEVCEECTDKKGCTITNRLKGQPCCGYKCVADSEPDFTATTSTPPSDVGACADVLCTAVLKCVTGACSDGETCEECPDGGPGCSQTCCGYRCVATSEPASGGCIDIGDPCSGKECQNCCGNASKSCGGGEKKCGTSC